MRSSGRREAASRHSAEACCGSSTMARERAKDAARIESVKTTGSSAKGGREVSHGSREGGGLWPRAASRA